MAEMVINGPATPHARDDEARQFRRVVAATYIVFLVGAVVARAVTGRWRHTRDGRPRGSIFAEARMTAHTILPFAFMR
ncbi:MAG: hypothetical protein RID91_18980 [Azospirillaceae bacterium]